MKTLDFAVKQETSYCIPLWLRDEQIKHNSARVPGRIDRAYEKRPEPIAIVCYGPSLNDTWSQVQNFRYIVSCSGSHKFLLEHGIVPTWHVEVDPRPHKVPLLGPPHPDVEYLIASTCHPDLIEVLLPYRLKLWHVFANEAEGLRILPRGEWALTGGSNAGLRALTIARFLGFTDLHIFGMDGCDGPSGKHAAAHPNQAKESMATVYDGVTYYTTPNFLECAKSTFHELDQMPDVTATFYGEGLVQHMARHYTPHPRTKPGEAVIAFVKSDVISAEYRDLNAQLHADKMAYGVGGGKHAETVQKLLASVHGQSVLDYGCGKGYLAKALPFPIWEYDPAIPEKREEPRPADLVVCTDVLEHVEPDKLDHVLSDLARCVLKLGYFVIHTGPAVKTYANGKNTHLIQQGRPWWEAQLRRHFLVGKIFEMGPQLHAVLAPLPLQTRSLSAIQTRRLQTMEAR